MSQPSGGRDTVSVVGLVVNSDLLTKTLKFATNGLQGLHGYKREKLHGGRFRPQLSAIHVCMRSQRLESSSKEKID